MKTMPELYQEALEIQNACNSSGLVKRLFGVFQELRELGVNNTEELNSHPVILLWLDKLNSLAKIQFDQDAISEAYQKAFSITDTVMKFDGKYYSYEEISND